MMPVATILEYASDSIVMFFTLLIHHQLLKSREKISIIGIIANSLIWGGMGMIFDDFSFLLFVLFFCFYYWIKEGKTKDAKVYLNCLLFSLSLEMIMFMLGGLFGELVGIFFPKHGNGLSYNNWMLCFDIFVNLILILAVVIMINEKSVWINDLQYRIKKLDLNNQIFWMLFSVYFSFEMILIVSAFEEVTAFIRGTITVTFISFLIFMIWQMINLIKVFSEREKMSNESEQNRQLGEYLKSIQEQYDDLRKFKHDFKNIVLSMNVGSNDKAGRNYDELYKELSSQKELDSELGGKLISEYKLISNGPLRGLIIQKFLNAKARGIKLNIEVMENIDVEENVLDIIRVLGIFIDNAVEETVKCATKTVNLAFIKNDDSLEVSVENPISRPVNLVDIFKQGYSTKGSGRGTGLYNVKRMIDNNSKLYLDSEVVGERLRMTLIVMEGRA